MAENKTIRLNKVLRELNISLDRAVEHLTSKGFEVEARPTTKISNDVYEVLLDGFQTDKNKRAASKEVGEEIKKEKEELRLAQEAEFEQKRKEEEARRVPSFVQKPKNWKSRPLGKLMLTRAQQLLKKLLSLMHQKQVQKQRRFPMSKLLQPPKPKSRHLLPKKKLTKPKHFKKKNQRLQKRK